MLGKKAWDKSEYYLNTIMIAFSLHLTPVIYFFFINKFYFRTDLDLQNYCESSTESFYIYIPTPSFPYY